MSTQRRLRRSIGEGKEVLKKLIDTFFLKSVGKPKEKILDNYDNFNMIWKAYVWKVNESRKQTKKNTFLMVDSFENAILNAHKAIKRSSETNKTKLNMLRILHPIQNKSKLKFFMRELPVWIKYILFEFPKEPEKKREMPKYPTPPPPPERILQTA